MLYVNDYEKLKDDVNSKGKVHSVAKKGSKSEESKNFRFQQRRTKALMKKTKIEYMRDLWRNIILNCQILMSTWNVLPGVMGGGRYDRDISKAFS